MAVARSFIFSFIMEVPKFKIIGMVEIAISAGNFPQFNAKDGMSQPREASIPLHKAAHLLFVLMNTAVAIDMGINARDICPIKDMLLSIDELEDAANHAVIP